MHDQSPGARTLGELQDPETTAAWRATVDAVAPGFDAWIVDSVFGGTYQRGRLGFRERQLLNLAALATLGGVEPQLEGQIRSSRRIGLSEQEIAEAFVHLTPYVGLPRVMAALRQVAATRSGDAD